MDVRWVEAFLAVAEELHFGRAAERLHMAQSPLSQTIKKLERQVGAPLFDRTTRAVTLTSAGHALVPHARRIVEDLDLALRATRAGPGEVYGRVRLGLSGALNRLTLPPLTRALRTRHPHVELELVDRVTTEDALGMVERGALDVSFVGLPVPGTPSTRTISIERLGAVVPPDHRFADRGEIALPELAGEDWVLMPGQSALRAVLLTACQAAGFRPRIAQQVKDPYVVLSLVAAGLGVSLAPTCVRPIMPSGAVWIPLAAPAPELHSALLWDEGRMTEAVRALLAVAARVLPDPVRSAHEPS
ncbi:LysR family transcriptional regulator [Pseudonocardia sp. WMMC193]|uniref:LysR family transcriptional regulator n=1 Tax=Pseudonocardia sp. WMMC193 TaxID=2911965 RepID=UPI001F37FCC4|nr:LysR substrate-binding domain-containing protein [Pseudonocardia sp. WMMC193]MCF7552332.1 LysR substrate-binding domain-containing protein [Pseudonocardia sp. WMMC193]